MSGTVIHYIKQHNHFLKLSSDCFVMLIVFNITCCTDMDSFSDTSKAVILVTFYIVLCLQNKTFVDRVQKYFGSGNCCGKSTKNLASLLWSFFPCHLPDLLFRYNVTFCSIKKWQVHFITHFSIFKYRIFMFFLF